ncbi:MAG: 50S ribosomal protein L6 [Pseudomonadota bacterium]
MSRVGKKPIPLPDGIKVELDGGVLTVSGPKGKLSRVVHPLVKIDVGEGRIQVLAVGEGRESRSVQGLTRTLVANMVEGLTKGFEKTLEISGVGYRIEQKGNMLVLSLGFSHPVEFALPEGVNARLADKALKVVLHSADKELLGLTAARIRGLRPPEPYKGKGIKYSTETIRRKVGKAGSK